MVTGSQTKVDTSAIQTPRADGSNTTNILRQLKESVEIGQRLRGDPGQSFVRVDELVAAGLARLVNGVVQPPNTTTSGAVPATRNINTSDSIQGGGSLAADLTLSLVGDVASPGNTMVYGTNGSGVRGWYAGGGSSSPLTTKGDLYGFSTLNARIPVGADGSTLTADSTQALGVKWSTAASPSSVILADSPIGFWTCSDASGGFVDSSGNGFNMTTVTGTVTFQASPLVPTLPASLFAAIGGINGSSSTAAVGVTSQLGQTYPLLNWSVEAYIYPLGATGLSYRIFDLRPSGSSSAAVNLFLASGTAFESFYPLSGNAITAPYTAVGRPVHVALTCSTSGSTSTLSYYINGVLAATATPSKSTLTGTMIANIGAVGVNASSAFIVGYVALFNTTLSAARVVAHCIAVRGSLAA